MSEPAINKWSQAAILVFAAFSTFLTAYREFGAPDANQDRKIAALVVVACLENETRAEKCKRLGLVQ
jgi:hypothetical protein